MHVCALHPPCSKCRRDRKRVSGPLEEQPGLLATEPSLQLRLLDSSTLSMMSPKPWKGDRDVPLRAENSASLILNALASHESAVAWRGAPVGRADSSRPLQPQQGPVAGRQSIQHSEPCSPTTAGSRGSQSIHHSKVPWQAVHPPQQGSRGRQSIQQARVPWQAVRPSNTTSHASPPHL